MTADTVDTTEALDDTHRVPVDVVVHQQVTVLEVLSFGNTVGGNEYVDFTILRHGFHLRPLFGTRRKVGEYLCKLSLTEGGAIRFRATGHKRNVNAEFFACPVLKIFVKVSR